MTNFLILILQRILINASIIILFIINYCTIMYILNRFIAKKNKLMVILGSGGHTGEMLLMIKKLNLLKFKTITFVYSKNDSSSLNKLKETFSQIEALNNIQICKIFRSRNVGQSFKSSIFTTLYSFIESVYIIIKYRPNLVIYNILIKINY